MKCRWQPVLDGEQPCLSKETRTRNWGRGWGLQLETTVTTTTMVIIKKKLQFWQRQLFVNHWRFTINDFISASLILDNPSTSIFWFSKLHNSIAFVYLLSLSGLVFSKQFLLTLVVGVTFGFSFAYMLLGAGPIFLALNVTISLHATLNSRSRSKGTLPRPSLSCGHLGPSRSPGLMWTSLKMGERWCVSWQQRLK